MASNVPTIQFTPTGLLLPDESALLAGAQADIRDAFGGDINPALETPQGQLATSRAAIIADTNEQFALFVNQVNPDTSSGAYQDAIARLYFLNRKPGTPTAVQVDCMGAFATVIPVGLQLQDTSGNRYTCVQSGTIPLGGVVTLSFANILNGPIPCPTASVTTIYQALPGLDSVNNPLPGVAGSDVESQAEFAFRRQESVAINAQGPLQAVKANVFAVPGVIDVYVFENTTNSTILVGATNFPLVEHSLYVAAVGGLAQSIGDAIFLKKGTGADMNGNTTVTVVDSVGYDAPFPTYTIKYQIPAALPFKFAVTINMNAGLPSNIVALTKAAIVAAFNGTDVNIAGGGKRVRIGSLLNASKFYPGITAISPVVSVVDILLGSVTPTLKQQLIGIDQAPTVQESDITVSFI